MAKERVTDELWCKIAPLRPSIAPSPKGGRPRFPDRAAMNGILFVLKTGSPWEMLPQELGFGCGMTCWRRLRDWQAAGVWERLHHVLLRDLRAADALDWSRVIVDSGSVPAPKGGRKAGRTPRTAGKTARKGTSPSTHRASRLRSCVRARTSTTASDSSP